MSVCQLWSRDSGAGSLGILRDVCLMRDVKSELFTYVVSLISSLSIISCFGKMSTMTILVASQYHRTPQLKGLWQPQNQNYSSVTENSEAGRSTTLLPNAEHLVSSAVGGTNYFLLCLVTRLEYSPPMNRTWPVRSLPATHDNSRQRTFWHSVLLVPTAEVSVDRRLLWTFTFEPTTAHCGPWVIGSCAITGVAVRASWNNVIGLSVSSMVRS